jgi:hypothetical protein
VIYLPCKRPTPSGVKLPPNRATSRLSHYAPVEEMVPAMCNLLT